MEPIKKKTPSDTTEFEREQLRFLLSQGDVSSSLAELNPSLAWLPELAKMKVIQKPDQLAPWIERNFADPEAVREVAANLEYFDEPAADMLEFRLNRQRNNLSALLVKSWQLIIRHIRNARRGALRNEWFELAARLKAGERSPEVLEKLAGVLRPRPKVRKRISWYDESDGGRVPKWPSDLMRIDYEIDGGINETEVLKAWPQDASPDLDRRLLNMLTEALDSALEDAVDAEVEDNERYSISDSDVPSVAAHTQNEYRTGFLPIVRVVAEIWTRLAVKAAVSVLPFVRDWSTSPLKLNRRLALFAAADVAVSADEAANVLLDLPQNLLFHTNTTVEVFRLIRARWTEFSKEKRTEIESRIAAGPPPEWFSSDVETKVDRSRYDLLGEIERDDLELSLAAKSLLASIRSKYPNWQLRPPEQAGFHIWHGGARFVGGDSQKFQNISDEALIDEAKKAAENADFMEGDHWQALCQSDPKKALRGLEAKAREGQWPEWAWNPFLWAAQKLDDPESVSLACDLLLQFPKEGFPAVAEAASWWLSEKATALDENRLWPLWDEIEEAATLQKMDGRNA
jgi:hypothetical protein